LIAFLGSSIALADPPRIIEPREPIKPTPGLRPASATTPGANQPGLLPQSLLESTTRFDPHSVEVRRVEGRYQVWSGRVLLKDFGSNQESANEANRVIRELGLNEYGAIGTPRPVMEYWLVDGQSPPSITRSRTVVPFNTASLRVQKSDGNWLLHDGRQMLFNFGPTESDAIRALAICKRHDFNQIGYIGRPTPTMTFMLHDDTPRMGQTTAFNHLGAVRPLPQMSTFQSLQLPKLGTVGTRVPFDPYRLDVQKQGGAWRLVVMGKELANLGPSDSDARNVLRIAQDYPFTEQCRVGPVEFFLSKGRAPTGVPLGTRSIQFRPESLTSHQVDQHWEIRDGRITLATARTDAEAKQTIQTLQHFHFDRVAEIGRGPALKYFARDH
jgi:hypothetical protein